MKYSGKWEAIDDDTQRLKVPGWVLRWTFYRSGVTISGNAFIRDTKHTWKLTETEEER